MINREDMEYVRENCQEIRSYKPLDDFKDVEITILKDRFVDKMSYRKIAKKRKLSFSTIKFIIKEAIKRCPGLR